MASAAVLQPARAPATPLPDLAASPLHAAIPSSTSRSIITAGCDVPPSRTAKDQCLARPTNPREGPPPSALSTFFRCVARRRSKLGAALGRLRNSCARSEVLRRPLPPPLPRRLLLLPLPPPPLLPPLPPASLLPAPLLPAPPLRRALARPGSSALFARLLGAFVRETCTATCRSHGSASLPSSQSSPPSPLSSPLPGSGR